jgi:hypothetical protein
LEKAMVTGFVLGIFAMRPSLQLSILTPFHNHASHHMLFSLCITGATFEAQKLWQTAVHEIRADAQKVRDGR